MVTLRVNGHSVPVPVGVSLFTAADQAGVRVPTSCVTLGKCKECVVEITQGMELLTPPTEFEKHLDARARFRLSCQCRVAAETGEVECHTMRRGQMRIERRALHLPATHRTTTLDPSIVRDGDRIVDATTGEEVARSTGPIHGLAIDLGTTTVVVRLIDLETGEQVADTSFENPQRFGGSDIMSRIHYDSVHPGRLLMRTVAGYLSHAIADLPADPLTIYDVVLVGNSTMRDLFFRQGVYTIGQNPYRSITEIELADGKRTTTSLRTTGRRSLLPIQPNARVYGLPIISGHVGADAAACMLAIDLAREDRLVALMDIGTNTELLVGNRHRILAASCPAGPAFEGGAIACGMPGLDGAIEDAERAIFFLEQDVNELAQAKGANVAGLQVVFSDYGIQFDDVAVFYLAGGFGRHLKKSASKRIGLIPNLADEKIVQVGNAALEGATIALVSRTRRQELETLVRKVEHCRLETHPGFFDFFVDGCQFRPAESSSRVNG
jgi:uncharacterized 2Fe-2S/4Fe-4S cluster protein (DUF4445 family)